MPLYDVLSIFNNFASKFIAINNVIVKIISSIFNVNLFDFSYFILWMINIIVIFRNISFITINVFILNKITTKSNIDYKKY